MVAMKNSAVRTVSRGINGATLLKIATCGENLAKTFLLVARNHVMSATIFVTWAKSHEDLYASHEK